MEDKKYVVQVALIKEVEVSALDELQAEKAAYAKLGKDKDYLMAMLVLTAVDGAGALATDNTKVNWDIAREKFHAVNLDWVTSQLY